MNVPHRRTSDLIDAQAALVQADLRHFASALAIAPWFWGDLEKVRGELELHGRRTAYIETTLAMVRANIDLVRMFQTRRLLCGPDDAGVLKRKPLPPLNARQRGIMGVFRTLLAGRRDEAVC